MVKDHVLPNCGNCMKARIMVLIYMVHNISRNIMSKF